MNKESQRVKEWLDKKRRECPNCGRLIKYDSEFCKKCAGSNRSEKIKEKTLGEYKLKYYKTGKHSSWITSEIRAFARQWNKNLINSPCVICGYSLHTELHHIKPISEFDDLSTIGEINDESNLMVLCPNHHWEMDNNLIDYKK